ncbi:hypothetical protein L3556_03390 [Candidatus Synechococcus calcipolaris G9]|uniref:Alpha/beta hydrolase n=1 Tax=Candidatus Synechococcus calcipolaris G9 TaxID=1497997 RepID=A0ABT6EW20_9SYNE|nr:hypothetical protein [Candidatus Synechococcus calcipolaris]MDG2989981.1 hypothetical protein [Candidatus Synechococcus calcipolaris G9]
MVINSQHSGFKLIKRLLILSIPIIFFFLGLFIGHYRFASFIELINLHRLKVNTPTTNQVKYPHRPNLNVINDSDILLYSDLLSKNQEYKFKYKEILLNDFAYDIGLDFPNSCSSMQYKCLINNENILAAYIDKLHMSPTEEAVLLIHGNSLVPDDFFNDHDKFYSNHIGLFLFQKQFDVVAPYVTHNSRFQNARRRLASRFQQSWIYLDIQRLKIILKDLATKYKTIHIIGTSYGAYLAGNLILDLQESKSLLIDQLGLVLCIEGWVDERSYYTDENNLFAWNWEMVFPGISREMMISAFDFPYFMVAYGTNQKQFYNNVYNEVESYFPNRIIQYEGGHEFNAAAINIAFSKYRTHLENKNK